MGSLMPKFGKGKDGVKKISRAKEKAKTFFNGEESRKILNAKM